MSKKKKPVRITALQKDDEKLAKIMEDIINKSWSEYGGIIQAISECKANLFNFYGIGVDDKFFNQIMEEVIKMRMSLIK